jgi:hypothetical protein
MIRPVKVRPSNVYLTFPLASGFEAYWKNLQKDFVGFISY